MDIKVSGKHLKIGKNLIYYAKKQLHNINNKYSLEKLDGMSNSEVKLT